MDVNMHGCVVYGIRKVNLSVKAIEGDGPFAYVSINNMPGESFTFFTRNKRDLLRIAKAFTKAALYLERGTSHYESDEGKHTEPKSA